VEASAFRAVNGLPRCAVPARLGVMQLGAAALARTARTRGNGPGPAEYVPASGISRMPGRAPARILES
jgi:hypothetical protein